MRVKTKTIKQLCEEGFLNNKDGLYLGESKSKPDIQITNYQSQFMLGEEYDICKVDWNFKDEPTFKTICGKKVPWYLVDGQLPDKSKFKNLIVSKKFPKGEIDICTVTKNIIFPCSMSRLSPKEFKEINAWVSKEISKLESRRG